MTINNNIYFIALNHIANVGSRTVAKLLKRWPNLQQMFNASSQTLEKSGIPAPLAASIANFDFNLIEADLRWSEQEWHYLLTWESPRYPELLKEIYDPPVVLYAKGNISALAKTKLAIVGTRNPSITGSENAKYFARALSAYDISIVSGLALGVDAQAHRGSLEAGGSTIAVMGTGLNCIYPRRHFDLAQEIMQNGLLMSEFPLNSPPIAGHFPRRNRIISGLSLSTLIIEAAIRSGSLITARFALEQNRDVLAIPSSIHNPQARGCHHLLQQGAKLVTHITDVLDALQINHNHEKNMDKPQILAKSSKDLIQWIGFEMTTIDQILLRSQADLEHVMSELANLELHGHVKTVPGGFIRC